MLHQVGRDGESVQLDPVMQRELADLQRDLRSTLVEPANIASMTTSAARGTWRAGQQQGGAAADELGIEQEEGQAAK